MGYDEIKDEIVTKIQYATEVVARSSDILRRQERTAPIIPTNVKYVVFGDTADPCVTDATRYLQSIGLTADMVDIDRLPDECRTFDIAFLPVVLEVTTGRLFISNPSTSRKGFDAWRRLP